MKRNINLQPLSQDHHRALVLARKISHQAENSGAQQETFVTNYAQEINQIVHEHFSLEERYIFDIEGTDNSVFTELSAMLILEHQQMKLLWQKIQSGDFHLLAEFSSLLSQHTRCEERQLFPLVEQIFSQRQLEKICSACK